MWGTTELELDGTTTVELELSEPHELDFEEGEYIQVIEAERFGGPYEVTPSATAQTLPTDGLVMTADVVVQPIPSNYGLIAWNGSTLTVS